MVLEEKQEIQLTRRRRLCRIQGLEKSFEKRKVEYMFEYKF